MISFILYVKILIFYLYYVFFKKGMMRKFSMICSALSFKKNPRDIDEHIYADFKAIKKARSDLDPIHEARDIEIAYVNLRSISDFISPHRF